MDSCPKEVSLGHVVGRLSAHLETLANDVHEIEVMVSKELGDGSAPGRDGIKRLQKLDYLRQSLEDAALLAYFTSRHCEGSMPTATGSKLRLETARSLLVQDTVLRSEAQQTGDVEFF